MLHINSGSNLTAVLWGSEREREGQVAQVK